MTRSERKAIEKHQAMRMEGREMTKFETIMSQNINSDPWQSRQNPDVRCADAIEARGITMIGCGAEMREIVTAYEPNANVEAVERILRSRGWELRDTILVRQGNSLERNPNTVNLNDIYHHPLRQGDYVESRGTGPAIAWGTQQWVDGKLWVNVSPTDGRDDSNGTRAWVVPVREITYFERRTA